MSHHNFEEKKSAFHVFLDAHKFCMLSELEITTLEVTACIEIQLRLPFSSFNIH